jgi:hypothetical protein
MGADDLGSHAVLLIAEDVFDARTHLGIVRARCKIGMTNLDYNMRRFICLERMSTAPGWVNRRICRVDSVSGLHKSSPRGAADGFKWPQ